MKKPLLTVVVVLFLAGAALIGGLWYGGLRYNQPASAPMTPVPIVSGQQAQSSSSGGQPAQACQGTAGACSVSSGAAQPAQPAGSATTFAIDPSQSRASFTLGEILAGQPNTVVGDTNQVSGEILVDPQHPAAARIGTIKVGTGGFVTDNGMRNRAIQMFILNTSSNPYITFAPTAITGLPTSVAVGQSFSFQVTGDLTIRDVTKSVVFDVKVTPVSATQIEGLASATISRSDFGLTIPNVPRVAGVDDKVLLQLQFVATPK